MMECLSMVLLQTSALVKGYDLKKGGGGRGS